MLINIYNRNHIIVSYKSTTNSYRNVKGQYFFHIWSIASYKSTIKYVDLYGFYKSNSWSIEFIREYMPNMKNLLTLSISLIHIIVLNSKIQTYKIPQIHIIFHGVQLVLNYCPISPQRASIIIIVYVSLQRFLMLF